MWDRFDQLEERIGYEFKDRSLIDVALTHSSYASEHFRRYTTNNERLEFIGDGYLDAIIGRKLFSIMPEAKEGVLSKTRANIVCERSLAGIGESLGIGDYLRLGHGEEASGGRHKESIIADAMEALIGAIYIDGGYDQAERFVLEVCQENIQLAVEGRLYKDYKTILQEKLQQRYKSIRIDYQIVSESGPDHNKIFTAEVSAMGSVLGRGTGKSKKEAEQAAAREAAAKGEI